MAQPKPRSGILDIQPYVGGEGRVSGAQRLIRLASNENPLGCSEKARTAYIAAASDLHRYPDGATTDIRTAIGKAYNLDPARIVCGAGSDELISLLIRAYAGPGDEVLYSQYGFLMYAIGAKAAGATPISAPEKDMRADIDALISAANEKTKLVFLANPNNPTGSMLTRAELAKLRKRLPESTILVIDAAYAEFVAHPDYEDGRTLVDTTDNSVMLRTFSKIHGLAALRLGWGYFPSTITDIINRVRGPFNVSAPAQAAGIAALDDHDFITKTIEMTNAGRAFLTHELAVLGYHVFPGEGNFILVRFGAEAEAVRLKLKEKGIFVRQMGAYGLKDCLRITIGMQEDNTALIAALKS